MIIVDPEKLREHREMIDADVAEIAIAAELSIPRAILKYANDELEHTLCMHNVGSSWCSCYPIPSKYFNSDDSITPERFWKNRQRIAASIVNHTVLSRFPEIAAIGAICRLIDPIVDISLDGDDFRLLYARSEWSQIVQAMPHSFDPPTDPRQRLLFETEDEYGERLATQAVALHVQLNTYKELSRLTNSTD